MFGCPRLKVPRIRPPFVLNGFSQQASGYDPPAMPVFAALSRLILSKVGLLFASGDARDAEILALRHQILVLQRQINRPQFTNTDRTILALLGSAMSRARRRNAF